MSIYFPMFSFGAPMVHLYHVFVFVPKIHLLSGTLPFLRRGSVLKRSDFSISSDDLVAPLSLTLLKGESPTALCSITLRSEGTAIRKVEGLHVMSLKARDTAEYSGSTDGKKEDLLEAISASEKKTSAIFFEVGVSKNSGTPKWMVYNGKPY